MYLKKITEDILHKIYTQKRCNNWHMISFIHCGSEKRVYIFPSGNKSANARKEVASYMGAQCNPLIKNLTTFEDDAEIR